MIAPRSISKDAEAHARRVVEDPDHVVLRGVRPCRREAAAGGRRSPSMCAQRPRSATRSGWRSGPYRFKSAGMRRAPGVTSAPRPPYGMVPGPYGGHHEEPACVGSRVGRAATEGSGRAAGAFCGMFSVWSRPGGIAGEWQRPAEADGRPIGAELAGRCSTGLRPPRDRLYSMPGAVVRPDQRLHRLGGQGNRRALRRRPGPCPRRRHRRGGQPHPRREDRRPDRGRVGRSGLDQRREFRCHEAE